MGGGNGEPIHLHLFNLTSISKVGTLADLVTEIHETIALAMAYALAATGFSFEALEICLYGRILLNHFAQR